MADFTFTIDPKFMDGLIEDAEEGLTALARKVAVAARKNAPRSKRDQYASVRAVVAKTTRSIPEDIDVTDYVVAAMKAQRDVVASGAHGDRIVKSSIPITGVRPPSTITGRELGSRRPMRVGLDTVLSLEGRTMGKRGEEVIYPLEHAEITKGTKKNVPRLVTGRHLQDSITVDVESTGPMALEATILADRPYAWFVEKAIGPGQKGKREQYRGFMERALAEVAGDIESGNVLKR